MAQLMPLPLTVSCFSKIQICFTFLVPAHLGSPGKRAVKRVCVWVLLMLQRSAHSRNSPTTTTDEKTREVLSVLFVISLVGIEFGGILKLKCTKFDFGWASAPDPLGELTAFPQTPQLD